MKDTISFGDFQKLDLRIGKVLEAESVEESDKLVKLQVDLGPDIGARQILAGVGKKYSAADLVGRMIVVVVNLESKEMMGLESEGMLLAASKDEGPVLLTISEDILPGAEVG
tara:strand:+ start:359 stop:694 length:336 start_codon:yes stop_codon:yes gene_type:complete